MLFNLQQETRYQKIFCEPLYQLDFKKDQNKYTFLISGSTKNVYEVSLKDKKFECSCPDAKTWSKKHHVVCKHICFVLFRVTKIFVKVNDKIYFQWDIESPSSFFETHKLSEKEQEFMENFLSKKQFGNDIMNESLKEKYLERVNHTNSAQLFQKSTKVLETSDECPICYDVLLNEEYNNVGLLLSCPDCKNYVHPKCMEKWLEYNKTCVYCRSDIWSKLNEKKGSGKNGSAKNGGYVNLN
jgi:hypothetical protein